MSAPDHSHEAEQCVIGALLIDPTAYWRVVGEITADDFHRREHRLIFRAIVEIARAGRGASH